MVEITIEVNEWNQIPIWQVLLIVQSNTTTAYSVHIQPDANNNSNGLAWPGLVHYNGTHCHLNDSMAALQKPKGRLSITGSCG
jgi:hypothetical protein